jgi:hypothetical protein
MDELDYDRTPLEDVLVGGLDDYIRNVEVFGSASGTGIEDDGVLRQLSIGTVAEMLYRGLAVPGTCTIEHGFVEIEQDWWMTLKDIVQRWYAIDALPSLDKGVFWLKTTPDAEEMGRAIWARDQAAMNDNK